MSNGGCPSHGWSIIAAASTNSQFAGLLTGFVFAGIVALFARRGSQDTQALGIFCAALIVLGADSYLFSMIAGATNDPNCRKVWSAGFVAIGMLGTGVVAMLSGVARLLGAHTDDIRSADPRGGARVRGLARQATLMVHGATVGIALMVARTTRDYLLVLPGVLLGAHILAAPSPGVVPGRGRRGDPPGRDLRIVALGRRREEPP